VPETPVLLRLSSTEATVESFAIFSTCSRRPTKKSLDSLNLSLVRAQASAAAVAVVVAVEEVVAVEVLLPVMYVAWVVAAVVALVEAASGVVVALLRAVTEVALALLLLVAMLPLLLEVTAAVVAVAATAEVEPTAIHPALAATLGGKSALHRFTIQPAWDLLSTIPWAFVSLFRRLALHFLLSNVPANPSRLPRFDTEIRNLIPHSAYRQRLFLCGSAYFRALLAHDTLRRTFVELEHRRQDLRLSRKGMHDEHLTPSFPLSMLLGEP
jgi:hypothetical protein